MKSRLSDNTIMPMTVINPPAVQEMNVNESKESTTTTNERNGDHNHDSDLEIEPL